MKLSEQGIEKVENYSSVDLIDEGFDYDDFEDVVVLPIDDAKEIFAIIEDCVPLNVIAMYKDILKDFENQIKNVESVG